MAAEVRRLGRPVVAAPQTVRPGASPSRRVRWLCHMREEDVSAVLQRSRESQRGDHHVRWGLEDAALAEIKDRDLILKFFSVFVRDQVRHVRDARGQLEYVTHIERLHSYNFK